MREPVFIVGMYKCGTSWLLSCLNAHPELAGVKELDLVKCLTVEEGSTRQLRARRERLEKLFGGTAWCRLTREQVQAGGDGGPLHDLDAEEVLRRIAAFQAAEDEPAPVPGPVRRALDTVFGGAPPDLLTLQSLDPAAQLALYRAVAEAVSPTQAMEALVAGIGAGAGGRRLVFKGADQITGFAMLEEWRPSAPKVAIVRDGRDAAISAVHFRRLMRRRGYAWVGDDELDLAAALAGWRDRAARVLREWQAGRLHLLRYEDLTLDFHGTLSALFAHLGVHDGWWLRARINHFTSFRAVTGRRRGQAADSIRRRGSIREWREALSAAEAARCWAQAGEELCALGYTENGALQPLPA